MRAAVIALLFLGACLFDTEGGHSPDALDESDSSGSGSNAAFDGMDPSPPDIQLELIVLALSAVIVAGPVRARRKKQQLRKNEL